MSVPAYAREDTVLTILRDMMFLARTSIDVRCSLKAVRAERRPESFFPRICTSPAQSLLPQDTHSLTCLAKMRTYAVLAALAAGESGSLRVGR